MKDESNKKILCIIPARGGSKGVPLKNIQPVGEKPLIYWTIQAALDAGLIDRLVVSTDHEEIANIARQSGAEVVARPEHLASDVATTESAMQHVLGELETEGYIPDYVALIQCTSPFLTAEIIRSAINKVLSSGNEFDSCLTVFKPDGYEYKWSCASADEYVPEHDIEHRPRRQELKLPLHENGAFYITKTDLFKKSNNRFGGNLAKITAVEMSEIDSLQIDSPEQLLIADLIMKHKLSSL